MTNQTSARPEAKAPLPQTALHQLHRASQLASDLFAIEMGKLDITPRQFVVLQAIQAHAGLSQTDLVNMTGIDRSTVADIVRRMQIKGLLRRKRTKTDARVYAVNLTEKSRKIMAKAQPAATRADSKLLGPLSPAERTRLLQYLEKMASQTSH